MAQAVTRIKKRIRAIKGSYKITSAMKLVSSVKLKKWKSKMLAFKQYAHQIDELSALVFSYVTPKKEDNYNDNNAQKNLYIVLTSSLGLCGSYNTNIFRLADSKIKPEDDVILLGKKALGRYQTPIFNKIDTFKKYSSVQDEKLITEISDFLFKTFHEGTYREIHLIHTAYKNSLVFHPVDFLILPLKESTNVEMGYPPIMEPSPEVLAETLIPLYLKNTIYAKFLESEVCEQAARSNAMENATKNAEELLDDLHIEFNKARQSAITQEITEIVGAANH